MAYGPVLLMSFPGKHTRAGRATVTRIDAVTQACRPMADYLFGEVVGAPPSNHLLRSAKDALLPLRGHPGRIGRAVVVLLTRPSGVQLTFPDLDD